MSKILVIPDIHGRDFWKEPCQKWQGLIVFLGDYHDPYPSQVSVKHSLENLEELVKFVTNNTNCKCLLGNHDVGYIENRRSICRHDDRNHYKVQELINKLEPQLIYYTDDHILFSHSGILPNWLKEHAIQHWWDLETIPLANEAFDDVSPYRGGAFPNYREHKVGSCLFGDVREYDEQPHISGYYQIFGHTQLESNPIIKNDYACLDCRRCFTVDTETKEIKEWNK